MSVIPIYNLDAALAIQAASDGGSWMYTSAYEAVISDTSSDNYQLVASYRTAN